MNQLKLEPFTENIILLKELRHDILRMFCFVFFFFFGGGGGVLKIVVNWKETFT